MKTIKNIKTDLKSDILQEVKYTRFENLNNFVKERKEESLKQLEEDIDSYLQNINKAVIEEKRLYYKINHIYHSKIKSIFRT
ncbi:MAG: hypothetical protein Q9M36_14735 [Sulfurovum sp.]|nr:hypothetical protein [Sulfurovum sp.]